MPYSAKSITLYSNNGYGYTLTASFMENSTNIVNNTSEIRCSADFSSSNASWSTSYSSTLTIYWHDNRENYDRQVASISFAGIGQNQTKTASGVINVTHNDDGSLSGYAFAYFDKGGTTSAFAANTGYITTDWTALTKIDRYATMTSATNFTDIQNPSFTYSNPRNLTMTAWLEINPVGTHYAERTISNSTSGTYTWELTEAERNSLRGEIPNSKTGVCRIGIISTISGVSSPSYKDVTFTIVDGNPSFNASYLDTNSTTTAITGDNQQIIRNQSTLQINVSNATAYKEATLSSIKAEINGVTYNTTLSGGTATFNIGTLNISTDTNALVTLTDSRGFTFTRTLNIEVLNWELPTAIINVARQNNFYTETDINVDADYSSLDGNNTISIKVRSKKTSDSTYGAYTTLQDGVTSIINLDNTYSWDIQILLEDRLGSTTYNTWVDRGIPIVFFDRTKRSVGIDCFPVDDSSLEVNGKNVLKDVYSTNEVKTNKIWVDGKPIYRKTIFLNSLPSNTNPTTYNHNISDVDLIYFNFECCFAIWNYGLSNQYVNPLPFLNYSGGNLYLSDCNSTSFTIITTTDRSNLKAYVTLEYTKTTD